MSDAPPRVGLVLGAGGVVGGAFHSAVLAALQETTRWDPRTADVIVGTSAGSVAAATLRAGLPAPDLFARSQGRPLSPEGARLMRAVGPLRRPPALRLDARPRRAADVTATLRRAVARPFSAPPWALLSGLIPEGTVSTALISSAVGAMLPGEWPDDDLWVCAVRQRDGRRVVFGRDDRDAAVADAVAASCAIPGFFAPVAIDGDNYIDGGIHSPTNADVLVDTPLDIVIVSSPMSLVGRTMRGVGPVRPWARALLAAEVVRLRRRGATVVAFQPTLEDVVVMGVNAMDADKRSDVASHVYASACRRLSHAATRERLQPLIRDRERP
jgi:NTE family protein